MKRISTLLLGLLVLSATGFSGFPGRVVAERQDRTMKRDTPKTSGGERRVALVIGNSAYARNPLTNPVNDAAAMTKALSGVGFDVITRTDVAQREMNRAISQFGAKLSEAGKDAVGLLYYAGHGLQVGGENYLIPIDAEIEREADVATNGVNLNTVLRQMGDAGNRLNIVILDACRDNPFVTRSWRTQSTGLAEIRAASGTFIAFATAPGSVASDGSGKNGLYTEALLGALARPGIPIESTFKEVLRTVRDRSGGKQLPWTSSLLDGDFYFVPASSTGATTAETGNPPPGGRENSKSAKTAVLPRASKAGETFKTGEGIELVFVPAGEFDMGSPATETGRESQEGPVHRVRLSKSFWIGKCEVTQAQWEAVMGNNPSHFKGCPDCPVEQVSWNDCRAFLDKLNAGGSIIRYDLPTEAEWEYACRAGSTGPYALGKLDYAAWYDGNSGQKTHPVGTKAPNLWGIHDMHGNVWEWCADRFGGNYYATGQPNDPTGPLDGSRRVVRGGSWYVLAVNCRSAIRGGVTPDTTDYATGFRVVVRVAP